MTKNKYLITEALVTQFQFGIKAKNEIILQMLPYNDIYYKPSTPSLPSHGVLELAK